MKNLLFTLNIVAPVFLIVFLGALLRLRHQINDEFSNMASKIIFNVALPVLIFLKLSAVNMVELLNVNQIVFCYGFTVVLYLIIWYFGKFWIKDGASLGAFIQGSVRKIGRAHV